MPDYMKYTKARKPRRINKKRTKLKRSSDVQSLWETRILEAEIVKDKWKELFSVNDLELAYEGGDGQRPEYWTDDQWFTINLIFQSLKILKRTVCPKKLMISMRLAKSLVTDGNMIATMDQHIHLRRAILQYMFDNLKASKEGQLAYLNAQLQFGVVKVGYSAELEDNENAGAVRLDEAGNLMYDQNGEPELEGPDKVTSEEFFIDQVDPECFLVDRYCQNDLDKTGRWCAQKIFRPVEDVIDDPMYDYKVIKDLEPSALLESEIAYLKRDEGYMNPFTWDTGVTLPENELLVMYEVYDLRERQILTLARGAHDLIRKPRDLPRGVALHPFEILKFNERRSSFYPIPGIFNWLGPQAEYNVTRNQMALHRKRYSRKYAILRDSMEPEEKEKLENPYDGVMVEVGAQNAIEPIKDAPVDPALYFDTTNLRNEFMEISGIGQLQRSQVGAESATEAEIVERRAREGEVDEHEQTMEFMSNVAKKLHNMVEGNLSQSGAVEMIGPYGRYFVPFGPSSFEQIAGEVVFEVEAEETGRMTLQVERAQLLQLMDIFGKNPALLLDDVLLRTVFKQFPAFSGNELLIARVARLGRLMLQAQAEGQGGASGGEAPSTGSVAAESRQVASQ